MLSEDNTNIVMGASVESSVLNAKLEVWRRTGFGLLIHGAGNYLDRTGKVAANMAMKSLSVSAQPARFR